MTGPDIQPCGSCDGWGFYFRADFTGSEIVVCPCQPSDPVPADVLERIKAAVLAEVRARGIQA